MIATVTWRWPRSLRCRPQRPVKGTRACGVDGRGTCGWPSKEQLGGHVCGGPFLWTIVVRTAFTHVMTASSRRDVHTPHSPPRALTPPPTLPLSPWPPPTRSSRQGVVQNGLRAWFTAESWDGERGVWLDASGSGWTGRPQSGYGGAIPTAEQGAYMACRSLGVPPDRIGSRRALLGREAREAALPAEDTMTKMRLRMA